MAAAALGHVVGQGADVGRGAGHGDADTGALNGRQIGQVVTAEGDLLEFEALAIAQLAQRGELVLAALKDVIDAQGGSAMADHGRLPAGDEGNLQSGAAQ